MNTVPAPPVRAVDQFSRRGTVICVKLKQACAKDELIWNVQFGRTQVFNLLHNYLQQSQQDNGCNSVQKRRRPKGSRCQVTSKVMTYIHAMTKTKTISTR